MNKSSVIFYNVLITAHIDETRDSQHLKFQKARHSAMSSLLIGPRLGKYQVIELLGQGGMATVYKGYHEEIDRYVAIKVLPPHPGLDAQFIERFKLEARTIARLQHPHIVPLYDYGEENGVLYLAMAFMDGGSLADLIDNGPMPLQTVEKILREIAAALSYAHRQGIIHRDIKPGNILLDSEGHALLADFGIVKLTSGGANLTGTGVVGTPAYMAPEQIEAASIDARVDIYALGAVVYEMLTGQQPYKGDTPMQVLLQHMQAPVPRVCETRPELPDSLNYVMQRVMSKDPSARYQTAVEFAEDLSRAVHNNDESWAGVQAQWPLPDRTATGEMYQTNQGQSATVIYGEQPVPQPTIIMQSSPASNPLVLLGGFALIALVLVIAVVLVLNNQNQTNNQSPTPNSQVASNPTSPPRVIATSGPSVPTFGRLSFTQSTNPGDTLQLQVSELSPVSEGQRYVAWLVNTDKDTYKAVGTLTLDAFGTGALTFVDPKNFVLPGWFDAVVITNETEVGEAPTGEVRYSGKVPFELTGALRNLLVDSNIQPATSAEPTAAAEPTEDPNYDNFIPRDTSLLSGVLAEAQTGIQHTGLAAAATNIGGLRTHIEHTINIFLGTSEDYNGNGRGENPGRKIGVIFYLDEIEKLLDAATNAPSASLRVQTEGELIRVCTQNVRGWVNEVVSLELEMLPAEDITTVEAQKARSTEVAGWILDGHDLNQNGVVEAFEGECGLNQIPTFGVSVANMDIVQGPLATN
jgi:serine/threonine-protein kinase